jgi:hypothetical protein
VLLGYPAAVIAVLYGFYDGRGRVANFVAFTLVLFEGAFVACLASGATVDVLAAAVVIFVAVGYLQVRRFRSGSLSPTVENLPTHDEMRS